MKNDYLLDINIPDYFRQPSEDTSVKVWCTSKCKAILLALRYNVFNKIKIYESFMRRCPEDRWTLMKCLFWFRRALFVLDYKLVFARTIYRQISLKYRIMVSLDSGFDRERYPHWKIRKSQSGRAPSFLLAYSAFLLGKLETFCALNDSRAECVIVKSGFCADETARVSEWLRGSCPYLVLRKQNGEFYGFGIRTEQLSEKIRGAIYSSIESACVLDAKSILPEPYFFNRDVLVGCA